MGMPAGEDDFSARDVSRALRGVEASLADFRHEMRGQLQQLVRADVYRAELAADRARIATIEKDIERLESDRSREREREGDDVKAQRRLVFAAFATGVTGVVVAIFTAVITAALA